MGTEATSDEPRFAVVSLHKNIYPLLVRNTKIKCPQLDHVSHLLKCWSLQGCGFCPSSFVESTVYPSSWIRIHFPLFLDALDALLEGGSSRPSRHRTTMPFLKPRIWHAYLFVVNQNWDWTPCWRSFSMCIVISLFFWGWGRENGSLVWT